MKRGSRVTIREVEQLPMALWGMARLRAATDIPSAQPTVYTSMMGAPLRCGTTNWKSASKGLLVTPHLPKGLVETFLNYRLRRPLSLPVWADSVTASTVERRQRGRCGDRAAGGERNLRQRDYASTSALVPRRGEGSSCPLAGDTRSRGRCGRRGAENVPGRGFSYEHGLAPFQRAHRIYATWLMRPTSWIPYSGFRGRS